MSTENPDILSLLKEKIDTETMNELKKSISFLSHELKRPLSSAILSAYTLKDGYVGELSVKQHEVIKGIVSDLDKMADAIKELLDKPRGNI